MLLNEQVSVVITLGNENGKNYLVFNFLSKFTPSFSRCMFRKTRETMLRPETVQVDDCEMVEIDRDDCSSWENKRNIT